MAAAPKFVSITVAARTVGVPVAWLRSQALAGQVPHLRTGRRLLFNVAVVEAVLLKRARAPSDNRTDANRRLQQRQR